MRLPVDYLRLNGAFVIVSLVSGWFAVRLGWRFAIAAGLLLADVDKQPEISGSQTIRTVSYHVKHQLSSCCPRSIIILQAQPGSKAPIITWEPLPADFVLPDEPVENIQQPPLAAALTDALGAANRIQPQMLIGSNFGLVATVNKKVVVKAPDWLYVPQVHPVPDGVIRRSYTPQLEGAAVAVVMEFLSEEEGGELSVRSTPPYGKLYFYERILQVPTYVTYDPYEPTLEVRYLQNERYVLQTANDSGRYWIPQLQLFLGIWQGERLRQMTYWLRWWDEAGDLLLWSAEQAEQERQRAEQAEILLEQERQQAEQTLRGAITKLAGFGLTVEQIAQALSLSVEEVRNGLLS